MTANNKTCTTKPKRDTSTTTATTKEAHQPDNMSSSKIADTVSSDALAARAPTKLSSILSNKTTLNGLGRIDYLVLTILSG
jgi:hypothetical protein